ncbi:hypothetical protein Salat_1309900 [Sesamum alatum]|uniref:Uncharacterized protein n=1 Tax=Sesamum alatum TaxID=300844 RepID=A0AAE1YHG0_9LAMI|nr:hypothetical protein Salat_1309900 [Sesamum alatum]
MTPLDVDCAHQPWLTEFWLLLAVISNANGSVLFMTRFLDFPVSWFAAVVFIIAYRLFFSVKIAMPIALDLCISLLCQFLVTSLKDNGWEFALSAAFLLNLSVFHGGYFSTHLHQEYLKVEADCIPRKKPANKQPHTPSLRSSSSSRAMIVRPHFSRDSSSFSPGFSPLENAFTGSTRFSSAISWSTRVLLS